MKAETVDRILERQEISEGSEGPAYTGEEALQLCADYVNGKYYYINYQDREDVIAQMAFGMVEAATRQQEGQGLVRAFQWSYARGYAKKWYETRGEIAKAENIRIDYHHGDDGDCEGEGKSLTMADTMADQTLPEGLSVELTEALSGLAPRERSVVILSQVEGYTLEEVVEKLSLKNKMEAFYIEKKALAYLKSRLTGKAA